MKSRSIFDSLEVRRAATRGCLNTDWLEAYFSFDFADVHGPGGAHFGSLRALNEDRVAPAAGFAMHPHADLEILLIPLSGAVHHRDSLGNEFVVQPDELLAMRAGTGVRHSQMNASASEMDRHLQLWLLPRRKGALPHVARRRYAQAGREGGWQLWASGHGEAGALEIDADARVWRARLAAGQGLASPLPEGRDLYLHVASGSVRMCAAPLGCDALQLQAGDAVAWRQGGAFTVEAPPGVSELLLVEPGGA